MLGGAAAMLGGQRAERRRAGCWLPFALPGAKRALLPVTARSTIPARSQYKARSPRGSRVRHPVSPPGKQPPGAEPLQPAPAGGCLPVPPAPRAPSFLPPRLEERLGAGLRSSAAAGGAAWPRPPLPGRCLPFPASPAAAPAAVPAP